MPPLIVRVLAESPSAAREAAEELRRELEARGVGADRAKIEYEPGDLPPGALALDAAAGPQINAKSVLERLGPARPPDAVYTEDEEAEVRRRLEDLGYL